MRRSLLPPLTAAMLLAAPAAALAQIVTGPAQAVDGDSLETTGVRFRLFGVDAPEAAQTCQRGGQAWACGQEAKALLAQLLAGKQVRCEQRDRDKYGRVVAVCTAGGLDLGQTMVARGMAVALPEFSAAYIGHEARARQLRLGMWAGTFDAPAAYRAKHPREEPPPKVSDAELRPRRAAGTAGRVAPAAAHQGGCHIKGNHSRRGEWIYHLPGMPYYAATRAEAMFCTEAQARAAGYRRAVVRP